MMITELLIILCILVLILSFLSEQNIYNPVFIFSGIWGFILIVYKIDPYDVPVVSDDTLLCIMVGILCFAIGALMFGNLRFYDKKVRFVKEKKISGTRVYVNDFKCSNTILIMQIIGVVLYLYLGMPGINAIFAGESLSYIRYYLRLVTLESDINGILITYVLAPIMYFSITYTLANIAIHNLSKRIVFSAICSVIMLIMELMTIGGRMSIMYTMVCIFICYFIYVKYSKEKNVISNSKIVFIVLLILGVLFMWKMAAGRNNRALEDILVYLYASVACFDRYRTIFITEKYAYTFGLLSLQGFTGPIFNFLGLSDLQILQNVDKTYKLIDSEIYLNMHRFNSETTIFGYFYFDGGIVAIAIFSLIFGFVCQKFYKNVIGLQTIKVSVLCKYMMMIGTIALSFIQFSFAAVGYALALVLIILLAKKKFRFKLK